jgi:hypothetical protein
MQQHGVRVTPAPPAAQEHPSWPVAAVPVIRLTRRLTQSRWWLAGTAANVCGTLIQATALHVGSVAIVQLALVTQLMFALPLESVWDRKWPRIWDWLSSLAICAGLALFFAVPGTAPSEGTADRSRVALAAVVAVMLVGVLVTSATGRPALPHATLVAASAGVCFATSAVLIKVTIADIRDHGVPATATDWVGYGLAVAAICGFILEQEAFAAGSLTAAVAATTITNPVTSYVLGVLAFHASFPESGPSLIALIGAAILIGAGVVGLAHSPTVRRAAARPRGQVSAHPARPR